MPKRKSSLRANLEITKFIDQLEPLTDTESSIEDTADLRHEIREAREVPCQRVEQIARDQASHVRQNDENIGAASADQIFALCSAKLFEEAEFDGEALHDIILDGSLMRWFQRLKTFSTNRRIGAKRKFQGW